jgi:hypothetical protein
MKNSNVIINATGAIRATPSKPIKRYSEASANDGKDIVEIAKNNTLNCEICGSICSDNYEKTEDGIICSSCIKELSKKEPIEEEEEIDYSDLENGNYPA